MWAITPQVRPFCTWTWKYCENSCVRVRSHTARNHFSGCGPSANLKSTNTHGSERGESKENKQSRGHQLFCLDPHSVLFVLSSVEQTPVRNTTLSAESLLNRTDVKKDQMVLMDNIHFRDTLECVFFSLHLQPGSSLWHVLPRLFSYKPPNLFCSWSRLLFLDLPVSPAHAIFFLVVLTPRSNTFIDGIDTRQTIFIWAALR